MVYHPYLSSWHMATSNLIGIITNLSNVFSAEPPVRSQAPGISFILFCLFYLYSNLSNLNRSFIVLLI
jgi:hypothetical protein